MSKKLLLFPFGGNAREALLSVLAVNEKCQEWDIVGFIDDDQSKHGNSCCGIDVVGGKEVVLEIPDAYILAVPGSPTSYRRRKEIIDSLKVDSSRFATIIHPSVVVAPDAVIGFNTIIMPNVVVSCGVIIGSHCIFLPNSVISHDSMVGDYCCFGSNITVSGSVRVGENCYIGSGAKMREHISVGAGTLIGLGSNIVSDIDEGVVAVGSPARAIRKVVP